MHWCFLKFLKLIIGINVLDLDQDPSISKKKIRNCLDCYSFMTSLKTYVNVPSVSNKQIRNLGEKTYFLLASWKSLKKRGPRFARSKKLLTKLLQCQIWHTKTVTESVLDTTKFVGSHLWHIGTPWRTFSCIQWGHRLRKDYEDFNKDFQKYL